MIPEKVYSIHISELILTALILTLVIVLQEASWLSRVDFSSTSNIASEQINEQ